MTDLSRRDWVLTLAAGMVAGACPRRSDAGRKLRVAAAADLTKAFSELAGQFKTKTGITVELEFGASGVLARQIELGAPFAMFAAANRSYVDQVVRSGRCDGATATSYARGQIVVWTSAKVRPPKTLAELADPRFKRIAIANPDQAPYGKAAKQALESAGLWPQLQDRILLGDNIHATMLRARNGDADAAIVAHSLAVAAERGASLPIDTALYAPLDQALVICGTGEAAAAAKQLAALIASHDGRELMTRYGFALPEEQVPLRAP
jgi:molybdate transport system substrate-binding protein